MELSSLVHEESSYLADILRKRIISAGKNLVIDSTLSSFSKAKDLVHFLSAHKYKIEIINVTITPDIAENRIRTRWENGYRRAFETNDDKLGGRWVPSDYWRNLYNAETNESICHENALRISKEIPSVKLRTIDNSTDTPRTSSA